MLRQDPHVDQKIPVDSRRIHEILLPSIHDAVFPAVLVHIYNGPELIHHILLDLKAAAQYARIDIDLDVLRPASEMALHLLHRAGHDLLHRSLPAAVYVADHAADRVIEKDTLAVRRVDLQRHAAKVCHKAVRLTEFSPQILLVHNDHSAPVNLPRALGHIAELIAQILLDLSDQRLPPLSFEGGAAEVHRFPGIKRQDLIVIDPVKCKVIAHVFSCSSTIHQTGILYLKL